MFSACTNNPVSESANDPAKDAGSELGFISAGIYRGPASLKNVALVMGESFFGDDDSMLVYCVLASNVHWC